MISSVRVTLETTIYLTCNFKAWVFHICMDLEKCTILLLYTIVLVYIFYHHIKQYTLYGDNLLKYRVWYSSNMEIDIKKKEK